MSQDRILHSSIGYTTGSCDILAELQLFAVVVAVAVAVARSVAVVVATTSTTPSTGVVPSLSSSTGRHHCSVI